MTPPTTSTRRAPTPGAPCPRCGNPIADHHTARTFNGARHHRVCAIEARVDALECDARVLILTKGDLLALLDQANAPEGATEAAEQKLLDALAALSEREHDRFEASLHDPL